MGAAAVGSTVARTWSTEALPESDQFAFWREAASEAFCPVAVDRETVGPFMSQVTARRVGPIEISRITSPAQVVTRSLDRTAVRSGDAFFLNLPLTAGTTARQDGRSARLFPGDFVIVDSTRPFELCFERSFDQLSLALPHDLIAQRLTYPAQATAVRVTGDRGVGAFASTALQRLITDSSAVDRAAARALADRLADVVALALGGANVTTRASTRTLLIQAALDEIERSLSNPDLAPADVAARVCISTRYLHRLFTEHGISFGRWVSQRRLQRCYQALTDPDTFHHAISQIAYDTGYRDPSHFARAFKTRYDVTPREARRQRMTGIASRD